MTRAVPQIGERGYERIALDAYRTPAWVTAYLLSRVRFQGPIWEPAAGEGDMARVLSQYGFKVITSDIREGLGCDHALDFTAAHWTDTPVAQEARRPKDVLTNPPFEHAEAFIRRGLELISVTGGKLALLLPFDYDTAVATRGDLFRDPRFAAKLVLQSRIRWVGLEQKASPRQNHAWFVWDQKHTGGASIIYPAEAAA